MSENTKIEWATHSWNPWIGCTKVSPGCKFCYAEHSTPTRVARKAGRELWGKGQARQRTSAANFGGKRHQTITRIQWRYESRCLQCGFEISEDSSYCGECTCEEDSL